MGSRAPVRFDYVKCTDEQVFAYDSDTHVDTACRGHSSTPTSRVVRDLRSSNSTLFAAGSTVGRVFYLVNTRWKDHGAIYSAPRSLDDVAIYTSTAFYVAPNTICTSRHVLGDTRYLLVCTYFTPKWRFLTSNVEDLVYTLQFPLNSKSGMARFNQAMADRGLYYVDQIFPLTPEHAEKFAHYKTLDSVQFNNYETKTWEIPNDFAFLHVTRSSEKWLVPGTTSEYCPSTCLIGYASEPREQKEAKLSGDSAARMVDISRVFGGFDVKFFAPGMVYPTNSTDSDGEIRLITHTTSCEAATGGAPLLILTRGTDYSYPTFLAVHIGGFQDAHLSIATPATTTTFCMEWATHVLKDIQQSNIGNHDPRIPQLIEYLKLVQKKWPSGYEHEALSRVNSMLAQFDQKIQI